MFSKLAITAFLLVGLPGCIFYNHNDKDGHNLNGDDPVDSDRPTRPDEPDTDVNTDTDGRDTAGRDTDSSDTDVIAALAFSPDHAEPGTTTIVSLLGSGTPDLGDVATVSFYGTAGVTALTLSHRDATELLVTVQVPANVDAGPQDVLVTFDDGTAQFLTGAFTVDAQVR